MISGYGFSHLSLYRLQLINWLKYIKEDYSYDKENKEIRVI